MARKQVNFQANNYHKNLPNNETLKPTVSIKETKNLIELERKDSGISVEERSQNELKKLLKETCQMLTDVQNEKEELVNLFEKIAAENETLKLQKAEFLSKLQSYRDVALNTEKETDNFQKLIEEKELEKSKLKKELCSSEKLISELQQKLDSLSQNPSVLTNERELNSKKEENEYLKSALKELIGQISSSTDEKTVSLPLSQTQADSDPAVKRLIKAEKEIEILRSYLIMKGMGEDFESAKIISEWQYRYEVVESELQRLKVQYPKNNSLPENQKANLELTIQNQKLLIEEYIDDIRHCTAQNESLKEELLNAKMNLQKLQESEGNVEISSKMGQPLDELQEKLLAATMSLQEKDGIISNLQLKINLLSEKRQTRSSDIYNSVHSNEKDIEKLIDNIQQQNQIIQAIEGEKQNLESIIESQRAQIVNLSTQISNKEKHIERAQAVSEFLAVKLQKVKDGNEKKSKGSKWGFL